MMKSEDAFDPGIIYDCGKMLCGSILCFDCYPPAPDAYPVKQKAHQEPKRFTQQEFDSMGNDKFFLPEKFWPEPVVNPKELAGAKKPATWSVMPRWVMLQVGRVMSVGAAKYGAFNYRESSISASTYQDAIERHLALWFDGEDNDDETGVSHLASVIASCALLMDAQATGKLDDDRQKTGIVREQLKSLEQLLIDKKLPKKKIG